METPTPKKQWSWRQRMLAKHGLRRRKQRLIARILLYVIIITAITFPTALQIYFNTEAELMRFAKVNVPHVPNAQAAEHAVSSTLREVTAYNVGIAWQTDLSPCIAANGENICDAVRQGFKRCAANFVPLGTDLLVEHFGQCKVTDRMNARFRNRVDVAMLPEEIARAQAFGLQHLRVTILK